MGGRSHIFEQSMKRVVFSVTNDLVYDQRMQKICTSLSKAGFEVLLIGRELKNSKPIQHRPYKQKRLRCLFNKGKLFYLEYNIRLLFFLLFSNADIYSAVDLDTALPQLIASKLRGKRFVYDAHEYFTEVPEVVNRPIVKKIWLWVEKIIVPRANECYTVSSSLAKTFEDIHLRHFEVIPNVPMLSPLLKVKKDEDRFILYQGALNRGRGLETLIRAMKVIPLKLRIAGEGDLSQELRQLVKQLDLAHKVDFLGQLQPEELKLLTPTAYLGYNVLEPEGLSYYYSLSNKFFDYMHAGVPSLSNDFPEYRAINEQYEVTFLVALNERRISDAVARLIGDEALYNRMQANCLLARDQYNWQKEEVKLIKLYNEA